MSEIYILRHGIAEPYRPGHNDAERALTAEGRKKLRTVLGVARLAGLAPALILTSPYRRALETAALAARVLTYQGELLQTAALAPDSSPQKVWEELRIHRGAESLLLVGHEPLFSQLTAHLLGAPSLLVDFKKGALVRIDVDSFGLQPRGVLRWFLTPKLAAG